MPGYRSFRRLCFQTLGAYKCPAMFRAISSDEFPPFGKFQLKLPPVADKPNDLAEVHLFTGVNGAGKTRILSVLAAMLGQSEPLHVRLRGSESPFVFRASDSISPPVHQSEYMASQRHLQWQVGGPTATWAQNVPAFAYSGAAWVSDANIVAMTEVAKPKRVECLSFSRPQNESQALLQSIANLKLQAAMDSMSAQAHLQNGKLSHATRLIQAIEATVAEITGRTFAFQMTSYPKPALEVSWGTGRLPIDLLPDGLRSIIGWLVHAVVMLDAWTQGKGDPYETEVVFLLDEIESHLHPAWQRRILPAFQRLFPKAQIFVATHSPFVIASLNHGWIHQLSVGNDGLVTNKAPIQASKGDSYVSVVEDIMGVHEWYDPETEQLLNEFRAKRDAAYKGDADAKRDARQLADSIGSRSLELGYMMGRELSQMDRQLAKPSQIP